MTETAAVGGGGGGMKKGTAAGGCGGGITTNPGGGPCGGLGAILVFLNPGGGTCGGLGFGLGKATGMDMLAGGSQALEEAALGECGKCMSSSSTICVY